MIACAAAGLATVAALWVARPDDALLLSVRLTSDARFTLSRPSPGLLLAVVTGVGVMGLRSTASQVAVIAVASAVAFGLSLRTQALRRLRARTFRAESAAFLRSWSAELRSGLAAVDAAHAAAGSADVWDPLRLAAAPDVPDALSAIAEAPGGEALIDAVAAWAIAEATGAPLAVVLERVSVAVQADVDVDREVSVEAAPARATARLMAFLPVVGIVLGTTLGADPLRVLFGSGVGVCCLVLGLALACVGVWWIERLVAAVDP